MKINWAAIIRGVFFVGAPLLVAVLIFVLVLR